MTDVPTPILQVEHVWFRYREPWILENVDLALQSGEFIGVIGPNGGGKSTLIKLMLGLQTPERGRVRVFGKTPAQSRHRIGYVPQFSEFNRRFPITVREAVAMAHVSNCPQGFGKRRAPGLDEALEATETDALADRSLDELSGGQLQRVLLARALANHPDLLILDEPTANIDMRAEKNIFELLRRLRERMTIIVVSHDVGFISDYIDRVACLNRTLVCHHPKSIGGHDIHELYDEPVNMVQHYHQH